MQAVQRKAEKSERFRKSSLTMAFSQFNSLINPLLILYLLNGKKGFVKTSIILWAIPVRKIGAIGAGGEEKSGYK